jgi:hypothetical protein
LKEDKAALSRDYVRIEGTMQDGLYIRLKTKALSNQLAIAVGSSCSDEKYSIPTLAEGIIGAFNLKFAVKDRDL